MMCVVGVWMVRVLDDGIASAMQRIKNIDSQAPTYILQLSKVWTKKKEIDIGRERLSTPSILIICMEETTAEWKFKSKQQVR